MPRSILHLCLLSSLASLAVAQGYSTDFETMIASPAGTPIAGQDGFYVAPIASSYDGAVFTYAGNTIGIPQNPTGGSNFYCGVNTLGLVRAQRSLTVPATSRCAIQFDVLCNYSGTAAAPVNYIGGVSLQPSAVTQPQFPTAAVYSNLIFGWPTGAVTPPTVFDVLAAYGPTAASAITPLPAAFQGLAVGVWHRFGITIDLQTKEYVDWSVTNGVTGITTVFTPPAPVPLPNQAATYMPTDFRLFTGGGAGNLMAIDNFTINYGATYDTFGAGCPGSIGTPTLAAAPGSLPRLGSTLQVDIGNLPQGIAIIATGFSNTLALGSVPLPHAMGAYGFPGCDLLVDPASVQFLIGLGTTASWNFAIPNHPSFAGITLYNKGISIDNVAPGAAFSNGGRCVLGL